jgi:hypothetical protein
MHSISANQGQTSRFPSIQKTHGISGSDLISIIRSGYSLTCPKLSVYLRLPPFAYSLNREQVLDIWHRVGPDRLKLYEYLLRF